MSVEVTYRFPFRFWSLPRVTDAVERLRAALPPEWEVDWAFEDGETWVSFAVGGASARVDLNDDDETCAYAMVEAPNVDPALFVAVGQAFDALADGLGGACEPGGETFARLVAAAIRAEAPLDTFDEVRDWLAAGFEVSLADEDLLSIEWGWNDTDRTQLVFLETAEHLRRHWLKLSSRVAPLDRVSAERMVELGGLANALVEDGLYWFVITVPYGLDATHLVALIDHLAALADDVEQEVLGTDEY